MQTDVSAEVSIVRATENDVERVVPLFDTYRQFYGARSDVPGARRFLAERIQREESVVFMALEHGTRASICGFAQLYHSFSSVAMEPLVILNDLFVTEGRRSRGVGRSLANEALAYAERCGAGTVSLATQHTNLRALALYESLGFVRDVGFTHLRAEVPRRDVGALT